MLILALVFVGFARSYYLAEVFKASAMQPHPSGGHQQDLHDQKRIREEMLRCGCEMSGLGGGEWAHNCSPENHP